MGEPPTMMEGCSQRIGVFRAATRWRPSRHHRSRPVVLATVRPITDRTRGGSMCWEARMHGNGSGGIVSAVGWSPRTVSRSVDLGVGVVCVVCIVVPLTFEGHLDDLTNLNLEGNVPTWFSAVLMAAASLGAALCGAVTVATVDRRRERRGWNVFVVALLALSLDEAAEYPRIRRSRSLPMVLVAGGLPDPGRMDRAVRPDRRSAGLRPRTSVAHRPRPDPPDDRRRVRRHCLRWDRDRADRGGGVADRGQSKGAARDHQRPGGDRARGIGVAAPSVHRSPRMGHHAHGARGSRRQADRREPPDPPASW